MEKPPVLNDDGMLAALQFILVFVKYTL